MSPTRSVQEFAIKPALFTQDRQPDRDYIAMSEVSSEARTYIPIGFAGPEVIASNTLQIIAGGDRYLFGVMCSLMHNAWVRVTAGRLKSDYRYTPSVYNNFPWPEPTAAQREAIVATAQGVLDARSAHPGSTLADLYDPLTMPPDLLKAHQNLDRAVDAAYGRKDFKTEADRVAFLFERYQQLTAPLALAESKPKPRRKRATS